VVQTSRAILHEVHIAVKIIIMINKCKREELHLWP
jgi:hypothetical protein